VIRFVVSFYSLVEFTQLFFFFFFVRVALQRRRRTASEVRQSLQHRGAIFIFSSSPHSTVTPGMNVIGVMVYNQDPSTGNKTNKSNQINNSILFCFYLSNAVNPPPPPVDRCVLRSRADAASEADGRRARCREPRRLADLHARYCRCRSASTIVLMRR
jgi:hypothetical protein